MKIRLATMQDRDQIEQVIGASARTLASGDYSTQQIEGALQSAWGLDTQLIYDKTYFVVVDDGRIVACGGWSYRAKLFGNDLKDGDDSTTINSVKGAAKIRAFFVDPAYSRQGLGSLIMRHCEAAAKEMGFARLELMATLPGQRLYERHGFVAKQAEDYPLGAGLTIRFVAMEKRLSV